MNASRCHITSNGIHFPRKRILAKIPQGQTVVMQKVTKVALVGFLHLKADSQSFISVNEISYYNALKPNITTINTNMPVRWLCYTPFWDKSMRFTEWHGSFIFLIFWNVDDIACCNLNNKINQNDDQNEEFAFLILYKSCYSSTTPHFEKCILYLLVHRDVCMIIIWWYHWLQLCSMFNEA